MTIDEQFVIYEKMMDFLESLFGRDAEIVLHDFRNLEKTIVEIRNSEITGRSENSGITDFALSILKNPEKYEGKNGIYGYRTESFSGKVLKSYSQFIRDEQENIVGMLCVNIDITIFSKFKDVIDRMTCFQEESEKNIKESFNLDIKDMMNKKLEETIGNINCEPSRLTPEEKQSIINKLEKQGVFLLKGSIQVVAEKLVMSEASVYRHLKKINSINTDK